jgi:hypothetical protein
VLWTFRFGCLIVPPIAGWATYRLCRELSARDGVATGSKVQLRQIPERLRHGPSSDDAEAEAEADVTVGS